MATEITVQTEDRPGILAAIGQRFGDAGVNIRAAAAFTQSGKGIFHFVVDDTEAALKIIEAEGHKVLGVSEVLAVSLDDAPGELGSFARKLADAGVNIGSFYTGSSSAGDVEVYLSVDKYEVARGL